MKLRTSVHMMTNAVATCEIPAAHDMQINEALGALEHDVEMVQALVDVVTRDHRNYHTEVSMKFCSPICQLAAAL